MMTLEEYEQFRESMQAEQAGQPEGVEEGRADIQPALYEASAEGEYHYAAIEEQD
jgi:hypothetical protein